MLRSFVLAIALTLLVAGTALAAHQIISSVEYVGGTTVATYQVIDDDTPAISHVTIPACLSPRPVVAGCPGAVEFGTDPISGVMGVKCDEGGDYTLTLTWPTELLSATGNAAIKAGPGWQAVPVVEVLCSPLSVTIERFELSLAPTAATFSWDVTSESNVVGYWVEQDGFGPVTGWVPANAGSTGFASYSVSTSPGIPYADYILVVQHTNGTMLEGARLTHAAPTAVTLGSFTAAGGACHWERKPRLRCQCGPDNPYSPWHMCLRLPGRR